jgi:hypothetical protein
MKLKSVLNEVSITSDPVMVLVPGTAYFFKNIIELKRYTLNGLSQQGQTNLNPDVQNLETWPINSDEDLQQFTQTYLPKLPEFKNGAMAVLVPHNMPAGMPVKKPLQ